MKETTLQHRAAMLLRRDTTFLKFLLVGAVNTAFGTAIMLVAYNVLHLSYWLSSAADYVLASMLSYWLNKHFTFRYSEPVGWRVPLRFALNIVVCYLLAYSAALPLVRAALAGISHDKVVVENTALLTGTVLFMIINYMGQRFFAFRVVETKSVKDNPHQ